MAVQPVPLPEGWEAKLDSRTNRYYFINHAARKTEWVDPRLNHPDIWTGQNMWRTNMLESLKDLYINASEDVIRQTLVHTGFDETQAKTKLTLAGYQQQIVRTSPTISDVSFTPPDTGRSVAISQQEVVDPFARMTLKSRFPQATDAIVEDVLLSVDNDTEKGIEKLSGMGYHDRQVEEQRLADQRRREEEERVRQVEERQRLQEEKRQREHEHNTVRTRITSEFPFVSSGYVTELLSAVNFDYERARLQLLSEENRKHLVQEFPDVPQSVIDQLLSAANQDINVARQIMGETMAKEKEREEERKKKHREHKQHRRHSVQPAKVAAKKIEQNKPTSNLLTTDLDQFSSDRASRSVPDVRDTGRSPTPTKGRQREGPVGPAAQKPIKGKWQYKTVALGADPNLTKGADRSLLTGGSSLAAGPDPANRKGSDRSLLQYAPFRNTGVLLTTQV